MTELDYNIGALRVIKILKECEILNIVDFLLSKTSEEDVQGIIGDIIDLDSTQQLLTEVIMSTRSSELISTQFHQCFSQYTSDVINRPDLIKNEFISSIEPLLAPEDFRELIAVRFMTELMAHDENEKIDLAQVLSNQMDWNFKFSQEKLKLVIKILKQISVNHTEAMVKFSLKQIQSELTINWFYLLFIIGNVKQDSQAVNDLKSNFG